MCCTLLWLSAIGVGIYKVFPRVWFGLTGAFVNLSIICIAFFINKLRLFGYDDARVNGWCSLTCCLMWKLLFRLNPQITLKEVGSTHACDQVPYGSYIITNHTSMIDSVVATQWMTASFVQRARSVVKVALTKIPIFGPIFRWCGHFPVYFKGTALTDFSVDRDRQNAVVEQMEEYVKSKAGYLVFSPEGVINRDPSKLLPFRHGSFNLALKYKSPIYAFIHDGCELLWPPKEKIGGNPATVRYCFVKIDIDYEEPELTAATIAEKCRIVMQEHVDKLCSAKKIA